MNELKSPARILVVDDEERNRKLLVAMLEAEGYAVVQAAGGEQALEMARQNEPDLILLDIMMPGMDGFEVVQALKEFHRSGTFSRQFNGYDFRTS